MSGVTSMLPEICRAERGKPVSYIATFLDSGAGVVEPIRTLFYPDAGPQENFAVDDRYLYISVQSGVLVYDKTASGNAAPIATLSLPFSLDADPIIAIGP
jgi:hypothetical protein